MGVEIGETLVAQCNLRGSDKREVGRGFRGRGRDVMTEAEVRQMGGQEDITLWL